MSVPCSIMCTNLRSENGTSCSVHSSWNVPLNYDLRWSTSRIIRATFLSWNVSPYLLIRCSPLSQISLSNPLRTDFGAIWQLSGGCEKGLHAKASRKAQKQQESSENAMRSTEETIEKLLGGVVMFGKIQILMVFRTAERTRNSWEP